MSMKNFFSSKKVQSILVITLILILTFGVFSPCLKAILLYWDDEGHLTKNPLVQELSLPFIKKIFMQKVNTTYHPLTTLSFAIEYHFAKYNPFIYHLDNVLLHLGVVFFVFLFLRQLGLAIWMAGLATIFFAIHPTRVESIAWVTERKDVLYGIFYMMGLNAYLRYRKTEDKRFYVLTVLLALLSMLSKAMALSFPLILLLCDWYQGRKFDKKAILEKIPIFVIVAAVAMVTYVENARFPIKDWIQAILLWTWTLTFYIKKFFYPGVLIPIYDTPQPITIMSFPFLSSFAVLFVVFLVFWYARRFKWFLFSLGYYFLSIFFLLRFDYGFDVHPVADRFLYLPCLGFCLFIAFATDFIFKKISLRSMWIKVCLAGILSLVIIAMAFKTYAQCKIWEDDYSLWSYQMKYNINTPIACNNLCLALELGPLRERYRPYLEAFQKNVQKDPKYLDKLKPRADFTKISEIDDITNLAERQFILLRKAFYVENLPVEPIANMGVLYGRLKLYDLSIAYLQVAIRESSTYMKARYDLAAMLSDLDRDEEAIKVYQDALKIKKMDPFECDFVLKEYDKIITKRIPLNQDASVYIKARKDLYTYLQAYRKNLIFKNGEDAVARHDLGIIYDSLEDFNIAAVAYQKELVNDLKNPVALLTLGNIYLRQKSYEEAIDLYTKLLIFQPYNKEAHLNIGVAYHHLKQYDKAIEYYNKAIELDPKNFMAYFDLGYLYENLNKDEKAISFYKKAVTAKPDYYIAYYNIGNIWLVKFKNVQKAEEAYRKALEIEPDHADSAMNLSMLLFYQKKYEEADMFCKKAKSLGLEPPASFVRALDEQLKNVSSGK